MVAWRKIEDLGSYYGGLTGKTKKDFEDGNAKFITYMNVFANPSLDESTVGMVHINEGEKQNKVQKGDILFTGSSETPDEAGMSCVITEDLLEDYYMNSVCFGLRLNNPAQFNLHYLKHLLRSHSIRNAISKTASGVTRFNISKARFGNIFIPVPSIAEQHRIVDILDTFTAAIDNLKQQIEQRRKQYEHYRDQLLELDGKNIKLQNIARYRRGSFPQPYGNSEWYDGPGAMPFVQVADVEEKYMRLKQNTKQYISKLAMPKSVYAPKGTVIVTLQGSIGKVAITQYDSYIDRTLGIFEGFFN